jgi:preprotein translocase subunit YajC
LPLVHPPEWFGRELTQITPRDPQTETSFCSDTKKSAHFQSNPMAWSKKPFQGVAEFTKAGEGGIMWEEQPITLANPVNLPKVNDHFLIMHLNGLNVFLAQAPASAPAQPSPTGLQTLLASPIMLLVLMGIMMYFLLFRPQQQQRKHQARMLANLKSGDKVVTSSGIIGVVITVKDKTVSLRSADAKMEVTKASVTEILESSDTPAS